MADLSTYGLFFFFSSRRRHTRFDCDWSSDVCSSDLQVSPPPALVIRAPQLAAELLRRELDETPGGGETWDVLMASLVRALLATGSRSGERRVGEEGRSRWAPDH